MSLPARAAAIRGDDYQHAIAWYWVCRALNDPDISSVSVEDANGGAFDDVIVRRRTGLVMTCWQVKSSNYGGNAALGAQQIRSSVLNEVGLCSALFLADDPAAGVDAGNRVIEHADQLNSQRVVDRIHNLRSCCATSTRPASARGRWI